MTRWRFVVLSYIPGTKSHRLTKELRQAVKVYELRLFDREQGKSCKDCLNEIDTVLDFYCHLCSIEMTCKELAQGFLYLASNGVNPLTGKEIIGESKAKRINAIMQLCGFYDEAGEFAFKVGLPGKSGVGGGIIAIHPGKYSIAVWSPKLNEKGNSYRGMRILEFFTTRTQSSIF